MGVLVDLTMLVTRLVDSVQHRKFAEELREIQRMIGSLQLEHAALHEQNMDLRTENMHLKEQLSGLKHRADLGESAFRDGGELDPISEAMLLLMAR